MIGYKGPHPGSNFYPSSTSDLLGSEYAIVFPTNIELLDQDARIFMNAVSIAQKTTKPVTHVVPARFFGISDATITDFLNGPSVRLKFYWHGLGISVDKYRIGTMGHMEAADYLRSYYAFVAREVDWAMEKRGYRPPGSTHTGNMTGTISAGTGFNLSNPSNTSSDKVVDPEKLNPDLFKVSLIKLNQDS